MSNEGRGDDAREKDGNDDLGREHNLRDSLRQEHNVRDEDHLGGNLLDEGVPSISSKKSGSDIDMNFFQNNTRNYSVSIQKK